MKRIAALLLLALVSFSCSTDTIYRKPGVYDHSLGGKWKTVSSTHPGFVNVNTSNCNYSDNNGLYWTFSFGAAGIFTLTNTCTGNILETGIYTYVNGELLIELDNTASYIIMEVRGAGNNRISMDSFRTNSGEFRDIKVILTKV